MDIAAYQHWLEEQMKYWQQKCYDEAEALGFPRQPRYRKYASAETRATYEAFAECCDKLYGMQAQLDLSPTPPEPLPPDHSAWQAVTDLFEEIDSGTEITSLTHDELRQMRDEDAEQR